MYNVNDVFVSKDKETNLRILSSSGEGVDIDYYCLLETKDFCWNAVHSLNHLKSQYRYRGSHKGTDTFSVNI